MVYTGQPSKGCATCRKRRIKCDEQTPECGGCVRTKQKCPGYVNHFDLAWRDQTSVAKKGVERGKAKRKAARKRLEQASSSKSQSSPILGASNRVPMASSSSSSSSSGSSGSPTTVFTPLSEVSYKSLASSIGSPPSDFAVQRHSTSSLGTNPYLTLIKPIPEEQALCFFFNNYVLPVRDPLARRGFLEHLGPFYTNADAQSPLKLSTLAVASVMMSTGMGRPPDSPLARSCYLRAVSRLKDRVTQQQDCASDELLVSVMLLQLYEATIGNLRKSVENTHPHLDGALALIRHRGPKDFKSSVSRQILFYVRSLLIDEAFRNGSPLPPDVQDWADIIPESEQLPGFRLDTINLDLANLKAAASMLIFLPPSESRDFQIQRLIKDAFKIDRRMNNWAEQVPERWLPIKVHLKDIISPTLQLYQDYCDVYMSMFLFNLWNKFRLSQIELRVAVLSCLDHQPPTFANNNWREGCQQGIQGLADDICASVPYAIGDRMRPGKRGDTGINYPRVPGRPPIMDHYATGPTLSGWGILYPLGALTKMKIQLRPGQREWLRGQMARTARIYNINLKISAPPNIKTSSA